MQKKRKKSIKIGHTDTATLKKGYGWYRKGKFVQIEALSVWQDPIIEEHAQKS